MPTEDLMDRTLRWMQENLSGALNAKYPTGHAKAGEHCTNSGTGIIVCCYINALGKVLMKGKGRDHERFKKFVRDCMPDFLSAGSTKKLPPAPSGRVGGEYWLYEEYRCGFVHAFYPGQWQWGRSPDARYWIKSNPPALNIDRLARGFVDGLSVFKQKVAADPDLRKNFKAYITAK